MFQFSHRSFSVLCSFILLSFCVTGCGISKKPKNHWWQFWRSKKSPIAASPNNPFNEPPPPGTMGYGDSTDIGFGTTPGEGMAPLGMGLSESPRSPSVSVADLRPVYFGFDEWHITEDTASTLDNNVDWVISNPSYHIQIQGHTDERGTPEYNTNLGQLRADTVREYLVMSGIEPDRLHPISYGEETPAVFGSDDQSYQENRRVEFLVYEAEM